MLFSVIVPIYKVEEYLTQCIDSILFQSYTDFELILIDDGSPDKCPEICNEYERKDSRVLVVHKENGGLSSARNAGLDIASGEYIIFVDSDDVIKEGAFEEISRKVYPKPDILITELFNTTTIEKRDYSQILYSAPKSNDKQTAIEFVFSKKPNTWASVQYIIKRELIQNNTLRFDLGYYHEDVSWTARAFTYANSFEYFTHAWYIRRLGREGSITTVVKPKRTIDMLNLTGMQVRSGIYDCLEPVDKKVIFNQMARAAFSSLIHYSEYSEEDQKKVSAEIKKNMTVFKSATAKRHKMFVLLMRLVGPDAAMKLYCAFIKH